MAAMADTHMIKTSKGKDCLCHNGFVYTKKQSKDTNVYWRCNNRDCSGSLKTVLPTARGQYPNIRVLMPHHHPPNHEEVAVVRAKTFIGAIHWTVSQKFNLIDIRKHDLK